VRVVFIGVCLGLDESYLIRHWTLTALSSSYRPTRPYLRHAIRLLARKRRLCNRREVCSIRHSYSCLRQNQNIHSRLPQVSKI